MLCFFKRRSKMCIRDRLVHGGIDCLQVGHERFQILIRHIPAGIAQLVEDAVLDLGLREGSVNGRVKSRQIVRASDEYVLYAPVLQAIEHCCPELRALIFPDPHAQNVFPAVQINAYGDVHRLLHEDVYKRQPKWTAAASTSA